MKDMRAALSHLRIVHEDYTEESTPKCVLCNDKGYYVWDVEVGHPLCGQAQLCDCRKDELAAIHLAKLREESGLPKRQEAQTFAAFHADRSPHAVNAIYLARRWAQDPVGWLVLQGPPGTGKTYIAACVVNYHLSMGYAATYWNVPKLLRTLRARSSPNAPISADATLEALETAPLLVLDDYGAQRSTDFADESLYSVLNGRYDNLLPSVITTNLQPEQIDPRIRGRISELGFSTIIMLDGRSG